MSDERSFEPLSPQMALDASKIWIEVSCELSQLTCEYFDRCGRVIEAALYRTNAGGLR